VSLAIELVTLLGVKPSGSFLWLLVRLICVPELIPRRELVSSREGTHLNSSSDEIVCGLLGGVHTPTQSRVSAVLYRAVPDECCRRFIVSSVLRCFTLLSSFMPLLLLALACTYCFACYISLSPPID
jgi:hypothetical protein